jgi:hypothetical protein
MTCPVCEAPATSRVCEVCGHAFAPEERPSAPPLSSLPDLDIRQPGIGEGPVLPLLDLEPTRFQPAAGQAILSEGDWERTGVEDIPDVIAGGLEELDTGRDVAPSERTPQSLGSVVCRYCRNVQTAGLMCDHCGMRLPWSAKASGAVVPELDRDALVRCPSCGIRTYQRERCAGCGSRLTAEG